jgi:ribonuclease P protein component
MVRVTRYVLKSARPAVVGRSVFMVVRRIDSEYSGFTIAVSKKIEPLSVDRHRTKRRIQALMRSHFPALGKGLYLLSVQQSPKHFTHIQLREALTTTLATVKMLH